MAKSFFDDDIVLIPGPSFHIDLSALDARHPVYYGGRLLLFCCVSTAQRDAQLAAFKTGLQALVSRCPILGGITAPLPPELLSDGQEDWHTIVPDRGIELTVKDLRTRTVSFNDLEATGFRILDLPHDLLMPIPLNLGNNRPFAACKMQFSAIEGGTILTLAFSHSVADGSETNELMRILCEETRSAHRSSRDR